MDTLVSSGDFYVTLPSNASLDVYPLNRLSSFRTKLNTPLQLEGQWEVALVELIFPTPLINVPYTSQGFNYMVKGENQVEVYVRPNAYKSIDLLIKSIKYFISDKASALFDIEYYEEYDRIILHNRLKEEIDFVFPGRIALLMGFIPNQVYSSNAYNDTVMAPNPPDLSAGLTLMYVYTNICEPQVVGDKFVPLLRVVPCNYREHGTKCKEFLKAHYVPVSQKMISEIQIEIFTDIPDESVPFQNESRVIAKLHFQKHI